MIVPYIGEQAVRDITMDMIEVLNNATQIPKPFDTTSRLIGHWIWGKTMKPAVF